MHVGGRSAKTANKTWEILSDARKEEVANELRNFKFPGQGQTEQPVITFKGALKLVMWIGGENAKKYRSAMVSILQRYYAGDGSLLEEVEANAHSAGPVQQMARASLVAEAVPVAVEEDALSLPCKKRRMELEMAKMEVEVEAQRIANRAAQLANTTTEREHLAKVTSSYRDLCEDKVMDERARLILKDSFLNMAILQGAASSPAILGTAGGAGGQGLLTNGKPISLSMVADQLGLKIPTNELISVGQELKKLYVERNGRAPSKHEQLCGGRATMVNTYMEGDRPLLEEVLRRHVAEKA